MSVSERLCVYVTVYMCVHPCLKGKGLYLCMCEYVKVNREEGEGQYACMHVLGGGGGG